MKYVKQLKNLPLFLCDQHKIFIIILLVSFCALICACGKRPRSLAPVKNKTPGIEVFAFPSPKKLFGLALENSFKLSWQAQNDPRLNGYALYKFEANRFLRHEPYAVLDKTVLTFTDTTPLRKHTRPCYAIRPSYLVNGIVTYGALSNVVCYQEK